MYRPDLDDGLKIMRLEGNPCPEGGIENFIDNPYLKMKRGELEVGGRESKAQVDQINNRKTIMSMLSTEAMDGQLTEPKKSSSRPRTAAA